MGSAREPRLQGLGQPVAQRACPTTTRTASEERERQKVALLSVLTEPLVGDCELAD